jgi:hypothetical protein
MPRSGLYTVDDGLGRARSLIVWLPKWGLGGLGAQADVRLIPEVPFTHGSPEI